METLYYVKYKISLLIRWRNYCENRYNLPM